MTECLPATACRMRLSVWGGSACDSVDLGHVLTTAGRLGEPGAMTVQLEEELYAETPNC